MKRIKRAVALVAALLVMRPMGALAMEVSAPVMPALEQTQAACVMDAGTGIVLFDKNMDAQHYPASTTKLMTVLLLLEYAEGHYAERVAFSHNAVFGFDRSSSHIAMDEGETLTIDQCLHAILLASANEASKIACKH